MPRLDPFAAAVLAQLPDPLGDAVVSSELPRLDDGPRDAKLGQLLLDADQLDWSGLDSERQDLTLSALWLLAGDLDRSHTISQQLGSPEGSFWHGIMHRREGDFGNSKYWFRRVGSHPVLEQLPKLTDGDYNDPFDFVDDCNRALRQGGEPYQRCQRAQWIEWQALLAHCLAP